MSLFVEGQQSLSRGSVNISGAKNMALPCIAASLIIQGTTRLYNVPGNATDLKHMLLLVECFGIRYALDGTTLTLYNSGLNYALPSHKLYEQTRYSILLLGALLHQFNPLLIGLPGGCTFGTRRPIDIHLAGFNAFGIQFSQKDTSITASYGRVRPGRFKLRYPSVGATINLILFAVTGKGNFVIDNSAVEPEITEFVHFLNACGAQIEIYQRSIQVCSVSHLQGVEWELTPDRIEVGTYAVLSAIMHKNLVLKPVCLEYCLNILEVLEQFGIQWSYEQEKQTVIIESENSTYPLQPVDIVTEPYPGTATDMQPLFAVLAMCASGYSRIEETVFSNRLAYVHELRKLGACIEIEQNTISVGYSLNRLFASSLWCSDIRSGAACVLAALLCQGESIIVNEVQIFRGYHDFINKLQNLGAAVYQKQSCTSSITLT